MYRIKFCKTLHDLSFEAFYGKPREALPQAASTLQEAVAALSIHPRVDFDPDGGPYQEQERFTTSDFEVAKLHGMVWVELTGPRGGKTGIRGREDLSKYPDAREVALCMLGYPADVEFPEDIEDYDLWRDNFALIEK